MHFIIDAMDQSKLHVPNMGTQNQYTNPLGQVIVQIKFVVILLSSIVYVLIVDFIWRFGAR